ncbi:MAG: permease prefix domain 1-containing protein [Bacteroidota bacterium]
MSRDNVCELESHLWDEMETLQRAGLSPEEAFIIAKRRIGKVQELTTEFEKVHKSVFFRNKMIPYLKGMLVFLIFFKSTQVVSGIFWLFDDTLKIENNNIISVLIITVLAVALFTFFYRKHEQQRFHIHRWTRIPKLILMVIYLYAMQIMIILTLSHYPAEIDFSTIKIYIAHNEKELLATALFLILSLLLNYSAKKAKRMKVVS